MITTGAWKNSGTTAHVALEIYGSEGKSGILQLSQEEPAAVDVLFSRGNSDVFVLYGYQITWFDSKSADWA